MISSGELRNAYVPSSADTGQVVVLIGLVKSYECSKFENDLWVAVSVLFPRTCCKILAVAFTVLEFGQSAASSGVYQAVDQISGSAMPHKQRTVQSLLLFLQSRHETH